MRQLSVFLGYISVKYGIFGVNIDGLSNISDKCDVFIEKKNMISNPSGSAQARNPWQRRQLSETEKHGRKETLKTKSCSI